MPSGPGIILALSHQAGPGTDGPDADAGALAPPVAGEGEQQDHGAFHEVAVVVLAGVEAEEDVGAPARDLAGELADGVWMYATEVSAAFSGV